MEWIWKSWRGRRKCGVSGVWLCGLVVRDVEVVVKTWESYSVTVATVWRRWDLRPFRLGVQRRA